MAPLTSDDQTRIAELEAALAALKQEMQQQSEQRTAELLRANRELRQEVKRHEKTEEALRRDPGDTRVLVFTLLIGSLIATIESAAEVNVSAGEGAAPGTGR